MNHKNLLILSFAFQRLAYCNPIKNLDRLTFSFSTNEKVALFYGMKKLGNFLWLIVKAIRKSALSEIE